MRKIINTYHKRLTFPLLDFSIEPNEIKVVSEIDFISLIPNGCLKEVVKEKQKDKIEEVKKVENKKEEIKVEKIINK